VGEVVEEEVIEEDLQALEELEAQVIVVTPALMLPKILVVEVVGEI